MEQIKRQLSNTSYNYEDNKKSKIEKDTTDGMNESTVSNFEHLSTELMYEIFEFLDYSYVCEAFSNLNQRFQMLLTHPSLPIKINISPMSKPAFQQYNRNIIETNMHRISLLRFSDIIISDFVFSSNCELSEFRRLQTLILYNIEFICLKNLLDQLLSLSLLSTLIITTVDQVSNQGTIYRQIFRLPALKYCKLSMEGWVEDKLMPADTNEYSSIEHLTIHNNMYLHQLDSLLSYVPRLHRLALHSLTKSSKEYTAISSHVLTHLTHVLFKIKSIEFDEFEQMVASSFTAVQDLRLTLTCDRTLAYIDANKWKELIESHMPNLRVFDIQLQIPLRTSHDKSRIQTQINKFTSPFWIEHQWFFDHQIYSLKWEDFFIFYSTNPYRRKYYTLYDQLDNNVSLQYDESNLPSVQHVHIDIGHNINNCKNYFPNATELTVSGKILATRASITDSLNRIIPLTQLTKLVILCDRLSLQTLMKILPCTPNVHTLKLKSMSLYQTITDDFQTERNTNVITHVSCDVECTSEHIRVLTALCPRMQHLTIDTSVTDFESIIRFLLDKTNPNTRHLFLLCLARAYNYFFDTLVKLLVSEKLLADYTLKRIGSQLCLWW